MDKRKPVTTICKLGPKPPPPSILIRLHSLKAVIEALLRRVVGGECRAMSVEIAFRSVVFVAAVMTAFVVS